MDDPDVVLRIGRDADRITEDPMIRQRLRPQRIDFEHRGLHSSRFRDSSAVLEDLVCNDQGAKRDEKGHTSQHMTFPLHSYSLHIEDVDGVGFTELYEWVYTPRR